MILDNIKDIKDMKLSEKEIDTLYLYVYMNMEHMSNEDRLFWTEILKKIDENFYEDPSNWPGEL